MMDGLAPGRMVVYVFDEQGAAEVNRRRIKSYDPDDRMKATPPTWPLGAQAHIGTDVYAGDTFPAMVIRVWGSSGCSNLKVFLDGTDEFWGLSRNYDEAKTPGTWHWPARA